jgi:hypothetical protein
MKYFKENLDTAVFTTRFVLEEKSPILVAYHFEDGSWQFSGKEDNLNDEDFKIISLGEIIEIDKTLLQISDMPLNSEARRLSSVSEWRIFIIN